MKRIVRRTPINEFSLSSPITVHIELTTQCNFRCRHCYNFWRDNSIPREIEKLNPEKLDKLFKILEDNGVMHIILTGGEPTLNFEGLLYATKKATELGMSTSLNSNLFAMTYDNLVKLKEVGLEHILTTLNSYKEETNDEIVNLIGAHKKIIKNIKNSVKAGIKISANLIVSKKNIDHIYETGKLCEELGVSGFFANRTVPPLTKDIDLQKEYWIFDEEGKILIQTLKRLENETDIKIGTLRTLPACFVGDLEEYKMFLGRGCPAGNKMICINVDGNCTACVHEAISYGNIYEDGLEKVWENMKKWRGDFFPQECQQCPLFDECNGGCRVAAQAYFKTLHAFDNLRNPNNKINFYEMFENYEENQMKKYINQFENDKFRFVDSIRLRRENGFYCVNPWGASTIFINDEDMEYYFRFKDKEFTLADVGEEFKYHMACFLRYELLEKC